jgi:hypothetical protein
MISFLSMISEEWEEAQNERITLELIIVKGDNSN